MPNTDVVTPNVGNFISSLRDIGYTFEIAVADVIDNSISAKATYIKIFTAPKPGEILCLLDNGMGMSDEQLTEAMRLASQNPNERRDKSDLGRFGLGLKTASFSQCKKLTVVSKQSGKTSIKQWDLDYISEQNEWLLITPEISEFESHQLFDELRAQEQGTLVIWQEVDRVSVEAFADTIDRLKKHLSLVFHRFLESKGLNKIKITLNDAPLEAFNPFNQNHCATQQFSEEKIKLHGETILVEPFILPHHSKLSQQEFERYATDEGYTKSQGFYLYRANRLLIYGTWWGLHKASDAHKLVRIKIDIPNTQDSYWGIDIKKSTARPVALLKNDLKRIIRQATERGSRPFTGRGRKIEDKATKRFWTIVPMGDNLRFALDFEHPVYQRLISLLDSEASELMHIYLNGLQAFLPLEAIQSNLQERPHKIKQEEALDDDELKMLFKKIKEANLDKDYIDSLLKTELFKGKAELLGLNNE